MNTLSSLFSKQANLTPNNIALQFDEQKVSYRQLEEKSNQLAHYLLQKGIKKEELIPICLNRSIEMIIGILGIIKAGAAYVPIDPEYPKERITYILRDTQCAFVITNGVNQLLMDSLTGDATLVTVDSDWDAIGKMETSLPKVDLQPNNLAYIIYTSGSTGTPKGVMIEHRNVVRLFFNDAPLFNFKDTDIWPLFHSFCFDVSVWEMYGCLLFGGKLIIVPKNVAQNSTEFGKLLVDNKVTMLHQTPSAFSILQTYLLATKPSLSLKYIIFAGEALDPTKLNNWKITYPNCKLVNMYGITEVGVYNTYQEITLNDTASNKSIIGFALPTDYIYALNENQEKINIGEEGELYIGGTGVARGYLNLPELSATRFIKDPFSTDPNTRLYRSGDLAILMENDTFEYLGRMDDQVKVNGFRVELGEIANNINQFAGIEQCIVLANETNFGEKKFVAYYKSSTPIDQKQLLKFLLNKMPAYMVPRIFVPIPEIPLTSNGKADKRALQQLKIQRPDLATIYKRPQSTIEKNIYSVWATYLEIDEIGIDDNFFELGGNSLLAQRTIAILKDSYNYHLPITKVYQLPTISALAKYIEKNNTKLNLTQSQSKVANNSSDIAVIGMAGRFPGADTIDELWELLVNGKESTTFFDIDTIDASLPRNLVNDPNYVKARGIINKADQFDPAFFGITPKLAELMDPQQRIFLEIAWEALEKTGHLPSRYKNKIGVFAGVGTNTYFENNVLAHPDLIENQGKMQVMSVNEKDYVASRTSYHLNLKGPGVNVNSACSTSLLAIAEAVNSLRAGQCDAALAGGASITSPINSGHLYQEGSMLSADGHCTPFNDNSTGTLFSDGAGVVLLKRLEIAQAEGDHIFAVIKGIGVNNDGADKGSFTAPSTDGQAEAIISAINDAQVNPSDITYVEAHGTGTPIGDPIEFEGLVTAFGEQEKKQYCAIGSIKSNFGHLTHAAGVAGFIKTCLALNHNLIPASLGFNKPNPHIDFTNSPFYVNANLSKWDSPKPRIAGVSSFGVGGTNVHVVLESYTNEAPKIVNKQKSFELISWSAQNTKSLSLYGNALSHHLKQHQNFSLADLAYTLHTARSSFKHRKFAVASSTTHLSELLANELTLAANVKDLQEVPSEIIFTFPGQGAQFVNMGLSLYEQEPVYKASVDKCATLLEEYLNLDIREIIFAKADNQIASDKLKNTKYTQPALFVTEYALAQLWMSWGFNPTLYCGHSVGEYVAAHLAGVFSLADGLKLIAKRGLLISQLPTGSMLSVRHEADYINNLLTGDLSIAAINSPKLCVVAGPTEQIADLAKLLDSKDIANKALFTSHAFHSSMMDPIIDDYRKVVDEVELSAPETPIISTVTGEILSNNQAVDPNYWTSHLRKTVQFAKAIEKILSYDAPLFLEVGPGIVTSSLIKQISLLKGKNCTAIASLTPNQDALESILNALGNLHNNGVDIDWEAYYIDQQIIELPTYQFDRQKYWLAPKANQSIYQTEPLIAETTFINEPKDDAKMRKETLTQEVKQVLEDSSGIDMNGIEMDRNFLEIGFDSLLLTQVATSLKRKFNLPITFRKLNEEYSNITALVAYLDLNMPASHFPVSQTIAAPVQSAPQQELLMPTFSTVASDNSSLGLIAQQLNILTKQLMLLQGQNPNTITTNTPAFTANTNPPIIKENNSDLSQEEKAEIQKPFGATPKIERQTSTLDQRQQDFLNKLIERYNKKTIGSKEYTAKSRSYMADPRVVSGFKPATKELIYPIVMNKSKGSRMWDLDGNEYIDALNGFGSNMLGYQIDEIKDAMYQQIDKGYEVGPQHELAATVSKMVCEFTGFDRAALCSTGSEAVLGCIRIARTVTGRSLIVAFNGSYHGIVDEVLVRGTKKLKSFPAAAGIMPEAVQNILVLDYGTPETLAIIKERGDEIAAVLVETIQSRRPEFVPIDFLNELRTITKETNSVLIFDEVITGFRFHPGGAQAIFGIKADLAAYGKVVGAGIPIGVIAGDSYLMDALDGGNWEYGDDSFPEIGVTYFAGTFVRHPLALASAYASLTYMKEKGPALQIELNKKGDYITAALNKAFEERQLPIFVANYGSLWKVKYHEELPYSELLFVLLREKGIHIIDGFPCFMTVALTYEDIEQIIAAFIESMDEMIAGGFYPSLNQPNPNYNPKAIVIDANNPPVKGAKLGKDKMGNPAWFIKNPEQDGQYLQIGEN